jgi:nicotinamide-nucleotide amidase
VDPKAIAKELLTLLKAQHLTVVVAESCTAGLMGQILSDVPGAGEHFHGGFVTYTKAHKTRALNVPADLLRDKGAVCVEVARAMAEGALRNSPADLGAAITGVAGPEPDEDGNPVGRVCIAVACKGAASRSFEQHFGNIGRDAVRERAVAEALQALIETAEPRGPVP